MFIVLALLILLLGVVAIQQTPTDIFPPIRIPVITVIWTDTGLYKSTGVRMSNSHFDS